MPASQQNINADTPLGATEFLQQVRLEDKVSILLTTEKPLYQPGQVIHVRALALDRSNHDAAANRIVLGLRRRLLRRRGQRN